MMGNIDTKVVDGFADEWTRYDQSKLDNTELEALFTSYFSIFPWKKLPEKPVGFDLGCGTGRWAKKVAPQVGILHCIDPSLKIIAIAKRNLQQNKNCRFHVAGADNIPVPDGSMDFGYSLGVLHHTPDTQAAIKACVLKLKPSAPLLLYLYYDFDNRPFWYRTIWQTSNLIRCIVSKMNYRMRYFTSVGIAFFIYLPLAKSTKLLEMVGMNVGSFPLSFYRNRSFYTMRTDALDRFGTMLENRFSRQKIKQMMAAAGLENIRFSEKEPFWCAVGEKR
ncbi:MAG: class I SAM-dependent methyltransferase [Desulfobacteraceae bacterium]|nr:MAG: class I SAM-dependent methyltransferase [Desulfobacteraceae bacterium]